MRTAQVRLIFEDDGSIEVYDNVTVDCTYTVAEGKMTEKERKALPVGMVIKPNEKLLRFKTLTLTESKLKKEN